MPPKYYPSPHEFERFHEGIRGLGFREITRPEFKNDFIRLGLVAPRPRKGREVGYSFHANQLTVRVWTSWLTEEEWERAGEPEREAGIREKDSGWVLISQDDEARYFCHPLHRTKNFLENLTIRARITRDRVIMRPLCPRCFYFMDIARGIGIGSRYWRCDSVELHENERYASLDWDWGLSEDDVRFVQADRKTRRKYREELRRQGKVVEPAIFVRKAWQQTRDTRRVG